jgi:hypothetical protein
MIDDGEDLGFDLVLMGARSLVSLGLGGTGVWNTAFGMSRVFWSRSLVMRYALRIDGLLHYINIG